MSSQDSISANLSPILMGNYGQNVLGSTYNSIEFVFKNDPGALKCQVKQPFSATVNQNLAQFGENQIHQIRQSCPRQNHTRDIKTNLYR
jgi:hypothetical protein